MKYTDLANKYITSIYFRVLIILYSIFLMSIQDNYFSNYIYVFGIVFYIGIYIFFLNKDWHVLRTLNDYLFIFFILFNKDIQVFFNVLFILFPILNSPNHTGKKRQPFLLAMLSFTLYVLLSLLTYENDYRIYLYVFVAFVFLMVIEYFEVQRNSNSNKLLSLYNKIDEVVIKQQRTSQLNGIYTLLLKEFSRELNLKIKNIIGFKKNEEYIRVTNSRFFVHTYEISAVLKELETNPHCENKIVIINGKEYQNTLAIKVDNYIFIFLLTNKIQLNSALSLLSFYDIAPQIFKKIVNVIEHDILLAEEKQKRLAELNKKSHFVNDVMKSTHYFSNKLTPIKNYFAMRTKYKNSDNEEFEQILQDEEKKSIIALELIQEKSLKIMDKENNPFIPTKTERISFKYFYMTVHKIWQTEFEAKDIDIISFDEELFNHKLKSDINTLELIFTDLIVNMKKYSSNYQKIIFDFKDTIEITLENDVKGFSSKLKHISSIADNYNNDDRFEINRRKSFGLSHIKELTSILHMDTELFIDKERELFVTKIKIKKVE